MTTTVAQEDRPARQRPLKLKARQGDRVLGMSLVAMAIGLAANSTLGPWLADVVPYPFTDAVRDQTVGLEAVSLLLVAPIAIIAGALAYRGNQRAAVLAFGPAAYTAYMFAQYVVGPSYRNSAPIVLLDLGMFIVAVLVAMAAWSRISAADLPAFSRRRGRKHSMIAMTMAIFILSRYLPILAGSWDHKALPDEYAGQPGMFWSIFLLDLGIALPAAAATAATLLRGSPIGPKLLYALVGWFALVAPSVAAMGLTMAINHSPYASVPVTVLFFVAATVFLGYAGWLYRASPATSRPCRQ